MVESIQSRYLREGRPPSTIGCPCRWSNFALPRCLDSVENLLPASGLLVELHLALYLADAHQLLRESRFKSFLFGSEVNYVSGFDSQNGNRLFPKWCKGLQRRRKMGNPNFACFGYWRASLLNALWIWVPSEGWENLSNVFCWAKWLKFYKHVKIKCAVVWFIESANLFKWCSPYQRSGLWD